MYEGKKKGITLLTDYTHQIKRKIVKKQDNGKERVM